MPSILTISSRTILMTCCVGESAVQDFLPHGLLFDRFDELFDDAEMHVGFEQRDADFAQRYLHILRREFPFAAQIFKYPLKLV